MIEKFTRTECACDRCRTCCKCMPGMLAPGDLEDISLHVGMVDDVKKTKKWIVSHFAASEGALVSKNAKVGRIPTIVPAQRPDGTCVFLNADDRCDIHSVSPFGCRMLDPHMTRAQSDPIVAAGLWRIVEDARKMESGGGGVNDEDGYIVGFYGWAWDMLWSSRCRARPLKERKAALLAAWDKLEM